MSSNKYTFNLFIEKAFPSRDPFSRKENGIIHNLIKWIALRFSYLFYRVGISANTLDSIALLSLFPILSSIYYSLSINSLFLFIISYLFMCFVLFIDFIDGPLANVSNFTSKIGNELDNLCPEICRMSSLIIIGYLSSSDFYLILSIVLSIVINSFVLKTREYIPPNFQWLETIFNSKISINGIRLLVCFIMPTCALMHIYIYPYASIITKTIIIVYAGLTLFWLIVTLKDKFIKR